MDWTSIGPIMGPTTEECFVLLFSYVYKTRTISSLVCFGLGRVGPLLYFVDMLGYGVLHIPKFRTLLILCM